MRKKKEGKTRLFNYLSFCWKLLENQKKNHQMFFGLCLLDIQSIAKEPYVTPHRTVFNVFCFVTYNNDETKIIQLSNAAEKRKKENAKPWKSNLNSINFQHYSRNFITMFGIQQMKQQIMFNHFYFTDLNIIHSMPKSFPESNRLSEKFLYIFQSSIFIT